MLGSRSSVRVRPGLRSSEAGLGRRLALVSTRLRLTLAFAAVIAVVLSATCLFLYLRFRAELDRTIDQGLRTQSADVTALIQQADAGLSEAGRKPLKGRGRSFAQILDARGSVFDATPELRRQPLLGGDDLRRALRGSVFLERPPGGALEERYRLLATPVQAQGRRLVVVAGGVLGERDDALRSLAALLLLGGPFALILASLAGYGVAAAALRPVESMRRRAAAISASEPGQRLPVPAARDEIGRLGATLNEMLGRLEASFARERAFVADASHELRTPLAILKTELELALRAPKPRDELEAALRSAAEETDRLTQLAEDLLVLARVDQHGLPVRRARTPVSDLFERVRDRFAVRVRDDDRELHVEATDVELLVDPLRIEQALGNLVENALRYGAGTITLRADARDRGVELHVEDEGSGFSAGFLPVAFERFSRSDPARGSGGAGLGLAIVSALARAHGGGAHAVNRPTGGADVWITLPRDAPADERTPPPSGRRHGARPAL